MRQNLYQSVQINGNAAPGYSSGQAMAALEDVFKQTMPAQMGYDWSGMSYQQQKAAQGVSPTTIFSLSFLVVFLIMAAQYESWTLPFSVLLGVPIAVFGAFVALFFRHLDNDVYAQIGLVMLIGLSAKNAILIVEFAKMEYDKGATLIEASLTGAKLRLRPILMTAFAFILGCVPLWMATGAGGISRQVLGSVVIGGMLAATVACDFLHPGIVRRGRALRPLAVGRQEGMTAGSDAACNRAPARKEPDMTKVRLSTVVVLLLSLSACKLGPNYQRPPLDVPGQYRGVAPDATTQQPSAAAQQQAAEDFAQMKWWTVFQDDTLQALIKEALANNYDMRIAAARILEASANLGITRANQFPTLNGTFSIVNQQSTPLATGSPTIDTAGLQLNYIVDFWGQYRRATEAAKAQLLSTHVRPRPGADHADLAGRAELLPAAPVRRAAHVFEGHVDAYEEILKLNTIKYKGGDAAITDVYQAQVLVQQAQAEVISLEQVIAQTENNISLLLGKNPQDIQRGLALTDQAHLPDVPVGSAFRVAGAASRCASR